MVSYSNFVYLRPDLDDHACSLVAADDREEVAIEPLQYLGGGNHVAGHKVVVAVAHARALPFDQHLTGSRVANLDLLDRPRLVKTMQHCCLAQHKLTLHTSVSLSPFMKWTFRAMHSSADRTFAHPSAD
jgi:hypothetical protein